MGRPLKHNLVGRRVGRLTVIEHLGKGAWRLRCDCGEEQQATGWALLHGKVQSCGCLSRELSAGRTVRHGLSARVEYSAWAHAKSRCFNPRDKRWDDYGGRGITICAEWRHDFAAFYRYLGPRPSAEHTLDRIDVNGHYEPGNVRWATRAQQANNVRRIPVYAWRGQTHTLAEWARIVGVTAAALHNRVCRDKWPIERALSTPLHGATS